MSADSPQSVEALTRKIEGLERNTEALTAAISLSRNIRLWLLLGVVVFIVVFGVMFFNLFGQLTEEEYQQKLRSTAIAKFLGTKKKELTQEQIYDLLMVEVNKLQEPAQEALQKAFSEQFEKDTKTYTELLENEWDVLQDNLQQKFKVKLDEHHHKILANYENVLRDEFPEITNKQTHERMMSNFNTIVSDLIDDYFIEELEKQMEGVFVTWHEFPVAGPLSPDQKKADLERADIIYGHLLDLLTITLAGSGDTAHQRK